MGRSSQGCAGQELEFSTLHPITTAQQDDCIDGTPVASRGDEHGIVIKIVLRLLSRIHIAQVAIVPWL